MNENSKLPYSSRIPRLISELTTSFETNMYASLEGEKDFQRDIINLLFNFNNHYYYHFWIVLEVYGPSHLD